MKDIKISSENYDLVTSLDKDEEFDFSQKYII